MSLSPTSLGFGNVAIGATYSRNLNITNTGTSNLTITSIVATAPYRSANCGSATIAPNGTCTLSVTFAPTATGSSTGTLTVAGNAANSPQVAGLSGTGVQPVSLTPTSLTFPNQAVGTASLAKTITVTNTQTVPLTIASVTTSGTFAAGNCPATLAPQSTCVISVTFTPAAPGSNTGTLTVTDGANNSPQTATLTGTGVQPVTLSQASLAFGNQAVNTSSAAKTITLTNNQSASLTLTSITTNSSSYGAGSCASPIAAYGTCAIGVTFTPASTGNLTGTLTVTDGASNSPQTASLSGTGVLPVSVTPASVQFPSQVVGTTSAAQSVTLSNAQSAPLTVTSVSATGPFTASACPASVAAGGTCVISVAFTPTATGNSSGTLTVVDGSAGSPQTASLRGMGSAVMLSSITVTPAAPSFPLGTAQQFSATGNYNNGTSANITNSVAWTSSAPGVAAISIAGLATSVAAGGATVTATSGSTSGFTTLTVTPPALVSIAVTPANPSIALGTTEQFTATGTYTDGSTNNITGSVTWASSNTGTASITAGGLATGVAVSAASITATSGSILGSTTLTVTSAALTTITVTPLNPSIPAGTTQQFTATGTFTDGSTQDLTSSATWTSSGNAVATINPGGSAQALTQGSVTISAASGSVTGTDTLTVTPAVLVSIAVTPANPSIPVGTTQQFDAMGSFSDGSTQDLTSTAAWSNDAPGVATMNATGLATAAGVGTTVVTASLNAISGTTVLTVTAAALVSIAVSPNPASVGVGLTQQFDAVGTYTDGSTQDVTITAYWSSSAGGVATVSDAAGSLGLATAVAQGATTITATVGAISGSASLTVVSTATLVSVTVSPANPSIPLGTSQQFAAMGSFSDGSSQDLSALSTWTSSLATVAPVSVTGLASSASVGSTTITATYQGVSGSAALMVNPPALVTIAVTPANTSVPLGLSVQYAATGTYSDGSQQSLTATATWTSSTTSATIGSTGLAASGALGSTTITATSGAVSGQATLTVTMPALATIQVSPASPSIPLGTTQQFAATGFYTDGSEQNLTSTVTWGSANTTVAAINAAGLATSGAAGSVTIVANLGTIVGSTGLTVTPPALVSIAVAPLSSSVLVGVTEQFTATGTFTDGSTQNLTSSGVTWSVGGVAGGNSIFGAVSTSGLYGAPTTAPNPAQVTITATSNTNNSVGAGTTVTILAIVVTVSPSQAQVQATETQTFAAMVSGSSNQTVAWAVNGVAGGNSTVGTITTAGLYTAPATVPNPAQVIVTATSPLTGTPYGSATITVIPYISVILSPSANQNVYINTSKQFTATVNGTANTAVTWSAGGVPGGNVIVGSVSSQGVYVAPSFIPNPQQLYVTATSVADPTKRASTIVQVVPPIGISVWISPVTSWVETGFDTLFVAAIYGTSNSNITWSVNGVVGGNSTVGTIVTNGNYQALYTAPSVVPVPAQVTVTATSAASPYPSASGILTVGATPFSATPVIDFTPSQLYAGQFSGMLYNGSNTAPTVQVAAGQAAASLIQPLDVNGNPNPNGKIVLISVGQSEALDDWCGGDSTCTTYSFMGQAAASPSVNHTTLAVMNGTYSGTNISEWGCAYGNCPITSSLSNQYDRVESTILAPAGLTQAQVQVVWLQDCDSSPTYQTSLPSSNADAYAYEYQLGLALRAMKIRWPNLQQVFLSSRIYAGYANITLNPEPYAYEYGFAVKWLVNSQMQQRATGTINPLVGDLLTGVPWIDWGPYLWGNDSQNLPGSSALNWAPGDFTSDGTHPSNLGVTQVGEALMKFFLNSPVTPWFTNQP